MAWSPDGKVLAVRSARHFHFFVNDLADLERIARGRLVRDLTGDECRNYMRRDTCGAFVTQPVSARD
jgi:hypothetical protein